MSGSTALKIEENTENTEQKIKNIIKEYKKLDEECEIILDKIKSKKKK